MALSDEEFKKVMIESQMRNQAILETILQTQIRILSKVKKEKFDVTKSGILEKVNKIEDQLKNELNIKSEE